MFGKDKNAILHTHLIVKVRKYKNEQPYFSLYTVPARESVEKLNELAQLESRDGWQEEYYSVNMTL